MTMSEMLEACILPLYLILYYLKKVESSVLHLNVKFEWPRWWRRKRKKQIDLIYASAKPRECEAISQQ